MGHERRSEKFTTQFISGTTEMPKELEQKLARQADKLRSKGKLGRGGKYKTLAEAKNAYIYGTMKRIQSGK